MVKPHLYKKIQRKKQNNWLGMMAGTCNPSYSGGRRIAWTREVEIDVSQDHATALQPGRQSETLSQKTKGNLIENTETKEIVKEKDSEFSATSFESIEPSATCAILLYYFWKNITNRLDIQCWLCALWYVDFSKSNLSHLKIRVSAWAMWWNHIFIKNRKI